MENFLHPVRRISSLSLQSITGYPSRLPYRTLVLTVANQSERRDADSALEDLRLRRPPPDHLTPHCSTAGSATSRYSISMALSPFPTQPEKILDLRCPIERGRGCRRGTSEKVKQRAEGGIEKTRWEGVMRKGLKGKEECRNDDINKQ